MKRWPYILALLVLLPASTPEAQTIGQSRGADSRVDYRSLTRFGPWDDRNYELTLEDLKLLAENEAELLDPIPVFYRVWLRRNFPSIRNEGEAQYPLSSQPAFFNQHGGYLVDGTLYRGLTRQDGEWVILFENGVELEEFAQRFLEGDSRVTEPNGAAESAVAIHPTNTDQVIAGTNGPLGGQRMHFSTDGGVTWTQAPPLLGGTCCDPTVGWSSDGSLAYTATLGIPELFFYFSTDGGQTWSAQIQVDDNGAFVDKEFLHVDTHPTSPFQDNIYMTWHEGNTMFMSRSTDTGLTWGPDLPVSSGGEQLGVGSDVTTDKAGNVYNCWPAFQTGKIFAAKSTDGGLSWLPAVEVDDTFASFQFPLPSMETRLVNTVTNCDADLSEGPFADSVYAAWTDTTSPESPIPANNHGRIQVAFSRDGGATWTTTTPHETDDAQEVDRYHPWLKVDSAGIVHVVFYDTRRDPTRQSVDFFHSLSTDGGVTWSTPERLTEEQSPNINDGFEFGDYNGMDIVGTDLIGIYTDNRDETGGGGDSVDVYVSGTTVDPNLLFSDGFESGDTSAWDTTAGGGD